MEISNNAKQNDAKCDYPAYQRMKCIKVRNPGIKIYIASVSGRAAQWKNRISEQKNKLSRTAREHETRM